jgi:hypothetical protein
VDEVRGALGLLPPEHVADTLIGLEAGAGDDLRQAGAGVVGGDRLDLETDRLARRRQRGGHRGEVGVAARFGTKAGERLSSYIARKTRWASPEPIASTRLCKAK